jgi:hypothetical protein
MQKIKNKSSMILLATLLILSMIASMTLSTNVFGQVYPPAGTHIPTYAFINVYPNPAGVGQSVTVNFFLSTPMENGGAAGILGVPVNMSIIVTNPDGTTKSLGNGNFSGDQTGGSFTTFVPLTVGTYKFQLFYGGQTLATASQTSYGGLIEDPSQSAPVTLTVQEELVTQTGWPTTALPTNWWQTPVSAQNVQQWAQITGPWLGLAANTFAATGSYNVSSYCNPYTQSVTSGHILWTNVWCEGGVAGGQLGNNEQDSSYWATRQYQPQYAPVVINGIMYSTQYPDDMGTNMAYGLLATDLYTGKTLWDLNTTNALRCGMVTSYHQINQYGAIGPFLWTTGTLPPADTGGNFIAGAGQSSSYMNTTGTQWNMYDALTGMYVLSIVNGSTLTLRTDEMGNLIGYYVNSTAGTEMTHPFVGQNVPVTNTGPHLTCVNMTMAIGQTTGSWQVGKDTVRAMNTGEMWSVQLPNNISGATISPALTIGSITGDAVVLNTGYVHGAGAGGEVAGWLTLVSLDQNTGGFLNAKNITYASGAQSLLPYTRTGTAFGDGKVFIINEASYAVEAFDVRTLNLVWSKTFTGDNGAPPNIYDNFGLKQYIVNGKLITEGLGGDVWAQDTATGNFLWYTNTTKLIGSPGIETPYGIWPLWVFNCAAFSNDIAYLPIGHEYNPPLFHGAQMVAINLTTGQLAWSELGMYIRSSEISYGILLSLNAYDNQVYAYGKGPSAVTISAPNVGVTTSTPITITGTVMDASAGTKQNLVASNFPNGLPCVSDDSMSHFMEAVYQQQTMPTNVTGVPISISVVDNNGNNRVVGTTTSDASGTFGFTWTPDIPGSYQITATFAGSNSYYPSSATTYAHAGEVVTPAPTAAPAQSTADMYFVPAVAGIIVAIAIVVALQVLMLLKKRP